MTEKAARKYALYACFTYILTRSRAPSVAFRRGAFSHSFFREKNNVCCVRTVRTILYNIGWRFAASVDRVSVRRERGPGDVERGRHRSDAEFRWHPANADLPRVRPDIAAASVSPLLPTARGRSADAETAVVSGGKPHSIFAMTLELAFYTYTRIHTNTRARTHLCMLEAKLSNTQKIIMPYLIFLLLETRCDQHHLGKTRIY